MSSTLSKIKEFALQLRAQPPAYTIFLYFVFCREEFIKLLTISSKINCAPRAILNRFCCISFSEKTPWQPCLQSKIKWFL